MKKIIITILLLVFSHGSKAQIPSTDWVWLIQQILFNYESLTRHYELIELMNGKFDLTGINSEMKIDNDNNAWANYIIRTNGMKADVHNLKVLRQSMPGINSCKLLIGTLENDCGVIDRKLSLGADDHRYVENNSSKTSIHDKSLDDLRKDIIERAFGNDTGPIHDSPESAEIRLDANPTDPNNLMTDNSNSLTLSSKDAQAIRDYIDLVAPPFAYVEDKTNMKEVDSRYPILEMTEKAYKGVPRDILHSLLAKRLPGAQGFSELSSLQSFVDEHFSVGDSASGSVAQTIASSKDPINDAIHRNLATMKAFQVHMAIKRYKLALERESAMAIMLSRKLDK